MLKKIVKNILIILFTAFLIIPLILMVLDYYLKPSYYEGFTSITSPSYSFEFRNSASNASVVDSISGEVAVTLSGGAYYDLSGMNLNGTTALGSLDSFEMGGSDMTFEVYMQYNSDQNSFARIFDIGDYASNDQSIRMGIYDDYNKTLFGIFKKNGTTDPLLPNTFPYLTTEKEMKAFLEQINSSDEISIDIEFMRRNTFFPEPCVIQLSNGYFHGCIDLTLSIDYKNLFKNIFDSDKKIILHSCRQDLEILNMILGYIPKNIFDTQFAASFLGFKYQIGYAELIKEIYNITIDKTHKCI